MEEVSISLHEMIISLSNVIDLVNPILSGHHRRVANISIALGKRLGLNQEELDSLYVAALLHDCGALSLQERLDSLQFDMIDSEKHSIAGYQFLKSFKPFEKAARIVRFHHTDWESGKGGEHKGVAVPIESHILHLSDRVDVLINRKDPILGQRDEICSIIERESDKKFMPELINVLLGLAKKEAFWLDIVYFNATLGNHIKVNYINRRLNLDEVLEITNLFENIIDFRSRFTATHSRGVSSVAVVLAEKMGLSEIEQKKLRIAGALHDLGKLAVPVEILEKPDKLTKEEFNIVRGHTFFSYRLLETVQGLEDINAYASFHHERLNGTGYPFRIKAEEMSLGSRIMGVADIFTAVTEDRPYRKGMDSEKALHILDNMAANAEIDSEIVSVLRANFDSINSTRIQAQENAIAEYRKFLDIGQ